MIFLIALLHAVPVVVTATLTKDRRMLFLAAAAMATIGILSGSAQYAFVDVLAVIAGAAIGLWIQSEDS